MMPALTVGVYTSHSMANPQTRYLQEAAQGCLWPSACRWPSAWGRFPGTHTSSSGWWPHCSSPGTCGGVVTDSLTPLAGRAWRAVASGGVAGGAHT